MRSHLSAFRALLATVIIIFISTNNLWAVDTDIYQSNVKQNCYILLDTSGSMGFGVYESNIDYAAMYDSFLKLNEATDPSGNYTSATYNTYIYDSVMKQVYEDYANENSYWLPPASYIYYMNYYANMLHSHHDKNRIYLVPGEIGITSRSVDGTLYVYSGDAADPEYLWHSDSMIDTYTNIDENGNLVPSNPNAEAGDVDYPRLTVDDDGYVLFDGERLPNNTDVQYRHQQLLYGGGVINDGFGDLVNAPGYYFSGFSGATYTDVGPSNGDFSRSYSDGAYHYYRVDPGDGNYTCSLIEATGDGSETTAYFFISGNWMNMQQVHNLTYITSNPDPTGAHTGDSAWEFETYDYISEGEGWPTIDYALQYPTETTYYEPGIEAEESIVHPGAEKIKVHFDIDNFDINSDGNPSSKKDWVIIQTAEGSEVARYNNDDLADWDGWTPEIEGSTARIILDSYNDSSSLGTGYVVDQYAYYDGEYQMKNRLNIATSSILNTIEHFRGQINWGTFTFPVASGADGATSQQVINPNVTDDENRENIASDFKNVSPEGGTPIGEALQEVFEVGYYQHRNAIDNLVCRRNYAIVLSDGFPSLDDNWELISDINSDPHLPFEDWDGDGYTADPYQYTNPPENYYDDVAHWMYTHSWLDKTVVSDPANSYVNVSSHQISFGFQNPLMEDAADEGGGLYITAYNEGQLNAAFYAIGLYIADAVSFTAPVVSVDAANKIQNGDDLYMGQFLPMDAGYWPGNLKKYKLGDGSELRPDVWKIYDAGTTAGENLATDNAVNFLDPDQLTGFWRAIDPDYVGLAIHHDGVGEVLTKKVNDAFNTSNFYSQRNIVFNNGTGLVDFKDNITNSDLGVTDTVLAQKITNWVYGYSFDANADGTPVGVRDWALGAIVHSRPTVIDYYDTDPDTGAILATVSKRLIAVGADDGMLHVFYDSLESNSNPAADDDGSEVIAILPTAILSKLQLMESENHLPLVDGSVKLFRSDGQPKYLFFGLRRGVRSYIRIDVSDPNPSNWDIAEISSTDIPELGQSWSDIEFSKIRTGNNTFQDVVIFSGGYDVLEDNFPEPFNDLDNNGTPYADNGSIDNSEWDKNDADQDIYAADNNYTISNPEMDTHGRGIFVLNIDTLNEVFSVTYDAADLPVTTNTFSTETSQTRQDMKYCFPATPSVVSLSEIYYYTDGASTISAREDGVLKTIYAPDIYGNLFRVTYDYNNGTPQWQVAKLFQANTASTRTSGSITPGSDDTSDSGRKVFYGPAVSWNGSGRYFDPSNYSYTSTSFDGEEYIASVFFGTGDREHPTYRMVRNRAYAIYDDIPVTASTGIAINSAPYTEDDLLNITCDELGLNTTQTAGNTATLKSSLQNYLIDDVLNTLYTDPMELDDSGAGENDAKGWYIILDEQGDSTYCSHCEYEAVIDDSEGGRDYHIGEKILSKFTLFSGNLYFTSYQPAYDDPCVPEGNAFTYALNYLNGAAALNLNSANDDGTTADDINKDVSDRYGKYSGVKGIPSSFEVVIRNGEAGAMSSIGGGVVGGGKDGEFQIPYENSGIDIYYWIEE